jgi:hypothetical protein
MAVKFNTVLAVRVSATMAAAIAEAAHAAQLKEADFIRRALAAVLACEGYFGSAPTPDEAAA